MLRIYGDYKMSQLMKRAIIFLLETESKRLQKLPYDGTPGWYDKKKEISRINKLIEDLRHE